MGVAFAIYEKEPLMTISHGHREQKEQTRQPKAIGKQCAIENPTSIRSIILCAIYGMKDWQKEAE